VRNQFPGRCFRCGGRVEAGEGHFERVSIARLQALRLPVITKNRWLTQHADCAITWRGSNHSINNDAPPASGDTDD